MKKTLIIFTLLLATTVTGAFAQKSDVVHLTKEGFLEKVCDYEANSKTWLYKGDKPAIIDFYADWCGPCRKLSPILEEIATELKGEIYVYKINTDKEPEVATAMGIRALPTLLFVPMEGTPSGSEGFVPKEELLKAIDLFLLKKSTIKE